MKRGFKKWYVIVMLCMIAAMSMKVMDAKAEDSKEMNIYGIYLKTEDKGDSVLLESKGNYLLMDVGSYSNVDAILSQLKSIGATNIDIYLSHLHLDHIGASDSDSLAGLNKLANAGITIRKMYLPAPELAPESISYENKYAKLESFMEGRGEIVYLNVGDTLTVGDVTGKIIGPLSVNKIHPNDYTEEANDKSAEVDGGSTDQITYTYYENNCSLAAIFTCGNTKFFTAGDCLEDEADFLVNAYGSALNADIMKLSHHGTGSGNTEALLAAVSPSYAFASNTGCADINPYTNKWRTNVARKNVVNTGMCYLIGNEKKTIIYQVKNDSIKMYQNSISSANMLTGWVKLVGADGQFRKTDRYYLDANGVPLKGVQKIDGNYYYFGNGGCMEYGNYSADGKYQYWKSYGDKRRYFTFTSDRQYAIMARGFTKVGSTLYYFDADGFKLEGNGKTELMQIGKYKYGVGKSGAIVTSNWATIGKNKYYFGSTGKMVTNKKVKIGSKYYYFGSDGKMVRGSKSVKLVKIGKYKYGVGKSGAIVISNWATVGKDKYYFGKSGAMVTNKKVKIGSKYYYFAKTGKMVRQKRVKISGKYYYFGKSGAMYRNKNITLNGKKYYCGNDGKMKLRK